MLSPRLLNILRAYWRLARPKTWLFPGRDGKRPIDPQTLQIACKIACKIACETAGLDKKVTVHTLRHSPGLTRGVTHLLENGTDIRIIQVLLETASYCPRTLDRGQGSLSVSPTLR